MAVDSWFGPEEYHRRLAALQSEMARQDLDVLLAFEPESVTYITGFFTKGYLSLQFAIIPVTGEPVVFCRDVEEYYLDRTAVYGRRILWSDREDPLAAAVAAIRRVVGRSNRIGIEKSSWQLNAHRYDALRSALPSSDLRDASRIVARLRLIKSPAELEYQRRAGRIAEITMTAGLGAARPGATERDIAIAVAAAMLRAGSDRAEPGPMASGERAFHIHGGYTDRVLQAGDTVHLEVCPHVRHHHARFMRAIKVEAATAEERRLATQLVAIQDRALAEVAPGVPAAVPDRVYREGIAATGATAHYPNKTFYSVGFLLYPNTGEYLEAAPGCSWTFEAGMTFHTYLIVRGLCFSETILVTPTGFERLTNYPRELLVS